MSPTVVVLTALGYLFLLFVVAYLVEHDQTRASRLTRSSWVYTLSLAAYCSSWTFNGGIGRASQHGLDFLPIYLGPTLTFCLGSVLIRKILRVSRANRITSIADLIAARFGKSTGLAALVTVIAVIGMIPYIALQLKSISGGLAMMIASHPVAGPASIPVLADGALWAAIVLTIFAMLFGSRSIHPREHHPGMVVAVALESILKLVALTAVGLFVVYGLFTGFGDLFARASAATNLGALFEFSGTSRSIDWIAMTLLAMAAIVCLPRQFQVMVVENVDERHLDRALWAFPLYLLLINFLVLPIALAGRLFLTAGANPDSIVLAVPLAASQPVLALVAFLGGLSASASMVVVEATALSLMVCNDVVMPALLRWRGLRLEQKQDLTRLLLWIRRSAMVGLMALGYLYMRQDSEKYALVSIGLMSFVAIAQFAPAIVAGLFWRSATKAGAVVGISAGFIMWVYTMVLPSFAQSGAIGLDFIHDGLFGFPLLRPQALFGLSGLDPVTHGVFWTLLANIGCLIGVSSLTSQGPIERAQAALFVDAFRYNDAAQIWRRTAPLPDLVSLVARFLGRERAVAAFRSAGTAPGENATTERADAEMVLFGERLLAGVVGAASARVLVSAVVEEEPLGVEEVMRILDETSRVIEANRRLEEKSRALEAATAELKEANSRLRVLDRLKDDFVATVNHELRTPLTSIRTFSEILRDHPDLPLAERREFLGIVVGETERLTRLINELLDLSKIEAAGLPPSLPPVDLGEVLRECAAAMGKVFAANKVDLTLNLGDQPAWVSGDRDRLVQVGVNLLGNAAKFSAPVGGEVTVSLGGDAESVELSVADNGPGVAPADREIVFERFRQVGDTLTGKPKGAGLGLAICKRIVAQHGGRIWVEGEAGSGAVFKVLLRRVSGTVEAEAAE